MICSIEISILNFLLNTCINNLTSQIKRQLTYNNYAVIIYAFTKHHEITFKILCILKGSYPRNWLGSCNILKDLTWYPVQDLKHLLGSCPRSWLGSLKSFRILCKILKDPILDPTGSFKILQDLTRINSRILRGS